MTAGSLILPPVIVLLSVAITVFIDYPTNEGGVTTIVISIKYGPVVPWELLKLTLILYSPAPVEEVEVILK